VSINLPAGFNLYSINELLRFNFKDSRIVEVIVKEGSTVLEVNNSVRDKLFFDYSIPKATRDGNFIQFLNEQIQPGTPMAQSTFRRELDLAGYRLDLTGDNGLEANRLRVSLNARLNPSGTGVSINANEELINYRNSFKGIIPFYARGFLGTNTFESIGQSLELTELKKLEGTIKLQDISMNLSVENSIGADFQVLISSLKGIKSGNNQSVNLAHQLIGTPQQIGRAQHIVNGNLPYIPVIKNYTLTTSNSNLKEFVELLPDKIDYSVSARLNPLGNVSSGNDFIYHTSNVKIKLELNLPLTFSANAISFTDTLETSGIDSDQSDAFRSGELRIIADNGFPFDLRVRGYLLDENKVLIDSLLTTDQIAAASVGQDLRVIQSLRSVLKIPVTQRLKGNLEKTRFIVLKARINTQPEQTLLPLYSDYSLKLKLVGDGTYRVKLN
jgi:hypothetical protein